MAKIHEIAYLIIGFFVSVISWKINYQRLQFFFYIGLILIIYGVARIVIEFINKEEKKEIPQNKLNPNQPNKFRQPVKFQYKRCITCGNTARGFDNFCSRCGARF